VTEARIALGSIAATPVRLKAVEEALVGAPIDPTAADLVADAITPIDDIRSTAVYRTTVATRIIRSWLENEAGQ
jgi:CO/xanthine dehydrogenase FAD-binding subunit